MKILFITYWGIDDGLSQATVFPHLKILSSFERITEIVYISIERSTSFSTVLNIPKVQHTPVFSKNLKPNLLNKLSDLLIFSNKIEGIALEHQVDQVISRGSMAGIFGYKINRSLGLPFHVESFEPHALYMLDSGTWKSYDPRFFSQKNWEKKQKSKAQSLIPVSHAYANTLIDEGISESKIHVIPCCVNLESFYYSKENRQTIRDQLGITAVCGIYVGKFGDIYYDDEAFNAIKKAFSHWDGFSLIILSPQNKDDILKKLDLTDLQSKRVHVKTVMHDKVANYLSAADFAFSFHKKTNNSTAFSPIKNGEYWATGLPIVISDHIGDDSQIVTDEDIGNVVDFKTNDWTFDKIDSILKDSNHRTKIRAIAKKHRSFKIVKNIYNTILNVE